MRWALHHGRGFAIYFKQGKPACANISKSGTSRVIVFQTLKIAGCHFPAIAAAALWIAACTVRLYSVPRLELLRDDLDEFGRDGFDLHPSSEPFGLGAW